MNKTYNLLYNQYVDKTQKLSGVWFLDNTATDIWTGNNFHVYFNNEQMDYIASLPISDQETYAVNLATQVLSTSTSTVNIIRVAQL